MKRFILLMLIGMAVAAYAQGLRNEEAETLRLVPMGKQQKLDRWVPAGNYSGICALGNGHYAVVSDKGEQDGYFVWHIDIDSVRGRILRVKNLGFVADGLPNRDAEAIAQIGTDGHICIAGEADNRVAMLSTTDAAQPATRLSANLLDGAQRNAGIESLCYDAQNHCLWAMEERGSNGQARLLKLDTDLNVVATYLYPLDAATYRKQPLHYARGVSEVLAIGQEHLLVLEREAFVPRRKIGAWTKCRLYVLNVATMQKRLAYKWHTRLNLTARSWANYEGMCFGPRMADGSPTILLVSDSQDRYGGVLHDWMRMFKLSTLSTP